MSVEFEASIGGARRPRLRLKTVEVDLGATPRASGTFDITGLSGLNPGAGVIIQQAAGPYTGKGDQPDEAEMDALMVAAYAVNGSTLRCYWTALNGQYVSGNFKFNYAT